MTSAKRKTSTPDIRSVGPRTAAATNKWVYCFGGGKA